MSQWTNEIRRRLADAHLDPAREAEIVQEVEQHLDDRYREMRSLGHDGERARRAALAELNDDMRMRAELATVTRREVPPSPIGAPGGASWIGGLWQDLRYAFRSLLRRPAFPFVAVITLALGIGANTALFSIADAVLFKPLPYPEPDRIVEIEGAPFRWSGGMRPVVDAGMLDSRAFSHVGLYAVGGLNAGHPPHVQRVRAAAVAGRFFGVLGAEPAVGRVFTDEELAAANHVVVISHALWVNSYARDPNVGGQTLVLNSHPYTVVGVMPPRVGFPDRAEVWVPAGADRQLTGMAFAPTTIARLAPGLSPWQARDEVERINDAGRRGRQRDPRELPVEVNPLREELVGAIRPLLLVVSAAVVLVLLVACLNTANLLLARVSSREREMAVRRALGATAGRLARYLFCESAVLAGMAGAVAVPAAYWTLAALQHLLPASLHGIEEVAIDARAIAVTAGVCLVSTLVFGLAPMLSVRRRPATETLRGTTTTPRPFWQRFRGLLVAVEVAVAVVLLAGALTVVRTVGTLLAVDMGASGERALTLQLTLPRAQYKTAADGGAFFDRLRAELQSLPIEAAGAASTLPGSTEIGVGLSVRVEGLPVLRQRTSAAYIGATSEFFDALGQPLLAGRTFAPQDTAGAPAVAVVSEGVPEAYGLPPAAILGRSISVSLGSKPVLATIVGVVRDVRLRGPERPAGRAIYVPYSQSSLLGTMYVVVKGRGEAADLAGAVRAAIARIDPGLPAYNVRTFDEIRASYLADRRFAMAVMLAFAALTTLLAGVGLYGVMSYLVQLRAREIGIRVALGASRRDVLSNIVRGGLLYAVPGVLAGAALSAGVSRLFISRVPGLQPVEAATLAVTGVGMMLAAAAATWLPARRASRIDPVEALRAEG